MIKELRQKTLENLTFPNILTLLRILLIIPFGFYFIASFQFDISRSAIKQGKTIVSIIFIAATLLDFFDGQIARATNCVTKFGKFLDPLADHLLIDSTLLLLSYKQLLPWWITIAILIRDIAFSGVYKFLQKKERNQITVIFLGKISTTLLMISLVLIITQLPEIPKILTWILLYSGLGFSMYSGLIYLSKIVNILRQNYNKNYNKVKL